MANLNNGPFIDSAIKSVQGQTLTDWELVIVDDGSSDDSRVKISDAVARDSRLTASYHGSTQGVGAAKAECVARARAPVVAVLDSDDCLMPNALEIHVAAHAVHVDASLVWSDHFVCDVELKTVSKAESGFSGDSTAGYLASQPGAIHHFWSCKKKHYMMTGGFSSAYPLAEDQDLFYKLEEVGSTLFMPGILYKYRMHDGGISTGAKTAEAFGWHLKAMLEALERRHSRRTTSLGRAERRNVIKHWAHFQSWGLPIISTKLLNNLVACGLRHSVPLWIIRAFILEQLGRTAPGAMIQRAFHAVRRPES